MVRLLAAFQVIGALLAYGGFRWWEAALPESVRALFLGEAPKIVALGSTRRFLMWALAAYLLLALLAWALPRAHPWPVAAVALLAAFAFFGGYERLREGSRKPFVIRDYMFSNGILVGEIEDLNRRGILAKAAWVAREADQTPESKGRAVFRAQCAACHTIDGYQSVRKLLAPVDADMLGGILATMREEGDEYASGAYLHEGHIDTTKLDYPFMPPLVGTDEEVEALTAYLLSLKPSHAAEVARAQ
jgi:mono/diheme cytochrome c family protein